MELTEKILYRLVSLDLGKLLIEDFNAIWENKFSQTEKVLFYFLYENNLTNLSLAEIFNFDVNKITQRLYNRNLLKYDLKESKSYIYNLSEEGKQEINNIFEKFLNNNFKYKDYIYNLRKNNLIQSNYDDRLKEIISTFLEADIKPNIENKIIIDMKKLAEIDYKTTELIYSNFKETLSFLKNYYVEEIPNLTENDIYFINIHESEFNNIHSFNRESKNIIYTKGLITSKKEDISSKIVSYTYSCINPECDYSKNKLNSFNKLKVCHKCKSKLEIFEEKRENLLQSKITDIETGISFVLYILGDKTKDFSLLGLGDEIEVIGHLEDYIEKENSINKVLILNNFWNTDYTKNLNQDQIKEAETIISNIKDLKKYLLKPFENYIEKDWIKELFLLQQLTRYNPTTKETPINISLMGEPGVGKNELIKISETFFPNCDAIVGADITDAGFKGTVNRETGIKEVGLAKKCQGGTLFFNEFDKFIKSNPNGKKAGSQLLNASITEQEIRLNKAGIRIRMKNLDLRHNIVFNPLEEHKKEEKLKYDYMGQILDKSLLSRMLPLYIGKDNDRSLKVFDLMLKPNTQEIEKDIFKYRLVIKYLRSRNIIFSNSATNKLKEIFESLIDKHNSETVSMERIGQMLIQLSYAITRINNKTVCGIEEIKYIYDLYLKCLNSVGINLDNLEKLFAEFSVEESFKISEIKRFIELELIIDKKFLTLETIKNKFNEVNEELIIKSIKDLIRDGFIYEFRQGGYKKC